MKLKKQVKENETHTPQADPHVPMKSGDQDKLEDTTVASGSQSSPPPQQPSSLIAAANPNTQHADQTANCNLDLAPEESPRPTKESKDLRAREQTPYFIEPYGKPFLRLCRVGALILKFIQVLLKKTLKLSNPDRFETIMNKVIATLG